MYIFKRHSKSYRCNKSFCRSYNNRVFKLLIDFNAENLLFLYFGTWPFECVYFVKMTSKTLAKYSYFSVKLRPES